MTGARQRRGLRAGLIRSLGLAVAAVLVLSAWVAWRNLRDESPLAPQTPAQRQAWRGSDEQVRRGAYLARVGHCAGCHTAPGGVAYAGGPAIQTPFGAITPGNLTPDVNTGLGGWGPDHFWRALHNGRSKDGRLLAPAFPYPNYTQVRRDDADALFAYLRSLAPVQRTTPAPALRFPFNTQAALAVWRALFFTAGEFQLQAHQSAAWNRGAYLVQGLGHCQACHTPRNALGASDDAAAFQGGIIPVQQWYAPSLTADHEAGVGQWPQDEVVALLKNGSTARATVLGPMADVVFGSTQYLHDNDLQAMAVFLQTLSFEAAANTAPAAARTEGQDQAASGRGASLYKDHCADCHGGQGEGARGAVVALAGNRAVSLRDPTNLIRIVTQGGFAPSTAGNPRPYGMPPFASVLNNAEMAAVLTYLRTQWGNQASPVTELQVLHLR